MTRLVCVLAACITLAGSGPAARAQNIFDLRGRPASGGLATVDFHASTSREDSSPMLARLDGILGVLSASDVKNLRACIDAPSGKIEGVDEGTLICILQLQSGSETLRVEVRRTLEGLLVARRGSLAGEPADSEGRVQRLNEDRFLQLSRHWSTYRGAFEPAAEAGPGGALEQLTPPLHGWITLTKEELGERLLRGRRTRVEGVTRKLADNEIWARAPKGYDPRSPAGLLVWVHASPNGQPPAPIFEAADQLGLVCISQADAGNDCAIADRYQRIFDAVATAAARYHVDPRRIYITGISGGGKVSSVLWACFPDLFSGCVPIVGLACYENVPIGNGQIWPGLYDKPRANVFNLLKSQRCAAITGPKDFNYDSIIAAHKVLERDGLPARVFEHAELAHTMPTPGQFAEALMWVDEPYREVRAKERAESDRLLAEFKARAAGASPPDPAERRRLLIEITRAGPWTPAAWEAARLIDRP
ncbi:MAG: hypothetical protein IT436_18580 [Phycisphaerales bacterium]|nr:hypothetical protein [Phycisphaerales bacterium]